MEKHYTVKEVAKMVGFHENTIYRHIAEGLLKTRKIGKTHFIFESDLMNYLKGGE